ncbi:MAG TPA: hypothetical protein VGI72_13465 [Gaiellales bacterium]|jgi:hypothetical protein
MRLAFATLAIALAVLAAAGCGGGSSSADKAKTNACNAVSDIQTQVNALKGLTPTPGSVDAAKTALTKISADLKTVRDSAPDVKGSLKQELQTANSNFTSQVTQVAQSITSAASVTAAVTALQNAGTALATSYQNAFAKVRC